MVEIGLHGLRLAEDALGYGVLAVIAVAFLVVIAFARGALMVFDGIEMLIRINVDDFAVFVHIGRLIGFVGEVIPFVGVTLDEVIKRGLQSGPGRSGADALVITGVGLNGRGTGRGRAGRALRGRNLRGREVARRNRQIRRLGRSYRLASAGHEGRKGENQDSSDGFHAPFIMVPPCALVKNWQSQWRRHGSVKAKCGLTFSFFEGLLLRLVKRFAFMTMRPLSLTQSPKWLKYAPERSKKHERKSR